MSVNKKRKSDVNIDSVGQANAKKEPKWYDEEQKAMMLAAPLDQDAHSTGRRSSFMGFAAKMKRMVSGSTMKEKKVQKARSTTAAQLSATALPNNFKENDNSFAFETSQESEGHLPPDKLANNYRLCRFVQTGEAPEKFPEPISDSSSVDDAFDTTLSSSTVFSMVTPSREFRREGIRRSSVRSMPESTNTTIEGLALTGVRRHASISTSVPVSDASPVSRSSRLSFRLFRSKPSSMADLPEHAELNTLTFRFKSFAPLAEVEETSEGNTLGTPQPKRSNIVRSASRLFSSGKKRTTLATSTEASEISLNTAGGEDASNSFSTPKNPATLFRSSPSSSSLQKRASNVFNIFRSAKNTPSPSSTSRSGRVQRSKTEMAKVDHRIRKSTHQNPRRSTLPAGGLHNMSLIETINETSIQQKKDEVKLFRKLVHLSEQPARDVLSSMEFDAILVDVLDGRPFSHTARDVLDHFGALDGVHKACWQDTDNMVIIYKQPNQPTLVCIKGDTHMQKDLDARVRNGVGRGLGTIWNPDNAISMKRILAYPMFVSESEQSDVQMGIYEFLTQTQKALTPDWNFPPNKVESIVLVGLSPEHTRLMTTTFDSFLSSQTDLLSDEVTETDI